MTAPTDIAATRRRVVGMSLPMPDAEDRVVGTLEYTVDHSVDGMLHAKLVRSPYPHARIVEIETRDALAGEGVMGVITGADIDQADAVPNPLYGLVRRDQPPLAIGKARYAGDPVVLVLADTPAHATAAANAVVVEYDEVEYVVDPERALADGAPTIHDEWPDNQCGECRLEKGDVDRAMAQAAHVFEATYTSPAASPVPFEPHVAIADWQNGSLEMWTSTQWPSAVQRELAHMFDIDPGDVRVRTLPLGGGYGAKSQLKIEPVVAAAGRLVGRPVRLELERDEVFLTIAKHSAHMLIRTGVDASGRFLAREIDLLYNGGAYAVLTPRAVAQGLVRSAGPYDLPNLRIRSRGAYTNTVPSGSFRGAMTNQAAFAYESHLDEIAAGLGIDPVELRMRNLLRDGDRFATGQEMDDVHFHELLQDVVDVIGWGDPIPVGASEKATGKGVGVILKTAPPGSRSEVRVDVGVDDRIVVHSSSVDMGQGLRGTLAQLTAEHLGVDYAQVTVLDPDTRVAFDSMTAGSRTTYVADRALREACASIRAQLSMLAGEQLETDPTGLRHESGAVVDSLGNRLEYPEILAGAGLKVVSAEAAYQSDPSDALDDPLNVRGVVADHWHQGAVAVEVEVDLETGKIELLRCHGAAWAGQVVNPIRARQQSEGGIIFGIGPALFEELVTVDGQVTNPNLSDYLIPSILDVPLRLTSSNLESNEPDADIHGVGEMTIPAVAPAIANAVARATGARIRDLPLTAERVLRALLGAEST